MSSPILFERITSEKMEIRMGRARAAGILGCICICVACGLRRGCSFAWSRTSEFLSPAKSRRRGLTFSNNDNNNNTHSLTWRSLSHPRQARSRSHSHAHRLTCTSERCKSGDSPLARAAFLPLRASADLLHTLELVTSGGDFCTRQT